MRHIPLTSTDFGVDLLILPRLFELKNTQKKPIGRAYGAYGYIERRFALRQTQWDEEERGDKRRRKTIRKKGRQRG